MIARIVRAPDFFGATWKNAREPADQAVFADVPLEVLAADECCVARLSIVVQCDTDERLLFDAVIDVNESIAFEGNAFAFQLQVNSSSIDVRHLPDRLDFACTLRSSSPSGSGSERLVVNSRGRTGVEFFLFTDVKETVEIFATIHFWTRCVDVGPRRRQVGAKAGRQILWTGAWASKHRVTVISILVVWVHQRWLDNLGGLVACLG